jgi:o-succinylbenzoate synthase
VTSPHRLRWHRESLELETPLANAQARWTSRNILHVILQAEDDAERPEECREEYCGEAAPLPGYSRETLAECEAALATLPPAVLHAALASRRAAELERALKGWHQSPPSARYALELAALHRLAKIQARPLWALLAAELAPTPSRASGAVALGAMPGLTDTTPAVTLCAWLTAQQPEALMTQAHACHDLGARSFKIKIGPDEITPLQHWTLAQMRAAWGNTIQLRVDANRSLDCSRLLYYMDRLEEYSVEWVEEPCADLSPRMLDASPCPVALDESLASLAADQVDALLETGRVAAVVLKPTGLGLFNALGWARRARAQGAAPVASHTLEGPIGYQGCVQLARALAATTPQPQGPASGLWPLAHQALPPVHAVI